MRVRQRRPPGAISTAFVAEGFNGSNLSGRRGPLNLSTLTSRKHLSIYAKTTSLSHFSNAWFTSFAACDVTQWFALKFTTVILGANWRVCAS